MKQKLGLMVLMVLAFFIVAIPVCADNTQELERKLDLLSDEVDDLKNRGFGAGTSDHNRVSVHGYGEMHYNRNESDSTKEIDNHRFVIGVHALLSDWIHLNAEIDFEHAAQELEFEFGHLDFLLGPALNFRAGVMIAPVGLLNETHEPNLFWTAERPVLQSRMIPTTWTAGGVGIFGTPMEGVNYRLYAMNSLQSITTDSTANGGGAGGNGGSGDSFGDNGIRGGRKQVNEAIAQDFSVFARVELTKLYPGLQLGFSWVNGDTTHGIIAEGGNMNLLEADIKYRWKWFDMNASIVNTSIENTLEMNRFCAGVDNVTEDCSGGIAENNFGYNVQAGIHLPQLIGWKTSHDIIPHFMFERVRTQDKVNGEVTINRARNRNAIYTFGVTYLPIPEVALKMDHTSKHFEDLTTTDQFNVAVAYMY
jgi:hypothetical protein